MIITHDIWIGSNYHAPGSGVFILGESTYGTDPPLREYIPLWIRRQVRDQTFSRMFNAFSGMHTERATESQRAVFWDSIAFYNFVTQSVGLSCDDRPTSAAYRAAKGPLAEVVGRCAPRAVLILGEEQARHSKPVVVGCGIPTVVVRHPAYPGLRTQVLIEKWEEVLRKRSS